MTAIFKREFKSYFTNITGYLFIALLLLFTGFFCFLYNLVSRYPNFEIAISNVSSFLILLVPILTMRSITDERRLRTDQLLYSLPLSLSHVVLGKYLAMISILLVPCAILCLYPVVLSMFGTVFFTTIYSTMIGFFLQGCAMIAIGMFMSSLTDNQVISFILAMVVFTFFAVLPSLGSMIPATPYASLLALSVIVVAIAVISWFMARNVLASVVLAAVLEAPLVIIYSANNVAFEGLFQKLAESLSLFSRLGNFSEGIFDITSIVYYLSLCVIFVFFTIQSMDKRRWS